MIADIPRRRSTHISALLLAGLLAGALVAPAWAQSISAEGDISTGSQLVSEVSAGTAPLEVWSSTLVANLNSDRVDGYDGDALLSLLLTAQQQLESQLLARAAQSGQTTCYNAAGSVTQCGTGIGLGQDGDLQLGVSWPNPRFTDNTDGTVTDNLTGLTWLKDASCFSPTHGWADALARANALYDGCSSCGGTNNDCGLSDGSIAGQWRLANVRELQSLVHYGLSSPALPDTTGTGQWTEGDPFSGVVLARYWSSTTYNNDTASAWTVSMNLGFVTQEEKTFLLRSWPVRGGQ